MNACEYFMSWGLAKAVGRIAEKGKKIYTLPMFMNCVAIGLPLRAGQLPSGGPLPRVHKIWRKFAPVIDLYGPDIYSPYYKEVSSDFATVSALIVPELGRDKDSASKALFTVAAYNTICFSPFGIEALMTPLSENDLLAQMNTDLNAPQPYAGELLAEAYRILHIMWPDICKAQEEGCIYAFLQQNEPGEEFILDDYIIHVTYRDGGIHNYMGQPGHRKEDAPIGGGFIIRQDSNRFLVCGLSCNVQVNLRWRRSADSKRLCW